MRRFVGAVVGLLAIAINQVGAVHNIVDFGAVHSKSDTETAFANAKAFVEAVKAANSSDSDREIYIPKVEGSGIFYMMPVQTDYLNNFTFTIDGLVYMSDDNKNWPLEDGGNNVAHFWSMKDSENIHIRGSGQIEGQGYWWWMREYIQANEHGRPHALVMNRIRHCTIEGVKWTNSPNQHLVMDDIDDFIVQDMEIFVNVFDQKKLAIKNGQYDFNLNLPTFPLNTDGIDPSGSNVIIRRVNITCYDDAVAVKPSRSYYKYAQCSENILVEDLITYMGVGMTIGSVPPNTAHNCVRNVTFRNIV